MQDQLFHEDCSSQQQEGVTIHDENNVEQIQHTPTSGNCSPEVPIFHSNVQLTEEEEKELNQLVEQNDASFLFLDPSFPNQNSDISSDDTYPRMIHSRAFSKALLSNFIGLQQIHSTYGYRIPDPAYSLMPIEEDEDTLFPDLSESIQTTPFVSPQKNLHAYRSMSIHDDTIDSIPSSLQEDIDAMLEIPFSISSQKRTQNTDGYGDWKGKRVENGDSLFSTGRGEKIEVSEEAMNNARKRFEEKEESSVNDNNGGGFSLFSTGRGKKIEVSEEAMNKAKQRLEEKEENSANDNNGGISLFSTGRGKKLVVSEEAMNKARSKLEDKQENPPNDNNGGFSLFSTGRGKKIEVSEEAMNKARITLQDKQENPPSDNSFSLFSTGRGKKLVVSEEAMNKARTTLQEKQECSANDVNGGFSLFTTGRGKKIEVSEEAMNKAKQRLEEKQENPPSDNNGGFSLFSTGRGKKIEVSEEAMNKARTTLQDKQDNAPSDNSFSLFSTGRGKKLVVSEEAMNKAKQRFEEKEESSANDNNGGGFSLFSTGRGKKLEISEEAMNKARTTLQDKQESSANDNNNGGFSLFSTGRGKKLEVSEEAMNKARSKLEEKQDSISPTDNSFSLFSTGRGKKLEVSEEAMNRARTTLQEKQENPPPSDNNGGFSLFTSGRGKKIEVSEEAMNKAKQRFEEKEESSANDNSGGFSLFTTGRGKKLEVSEEAMNKARTTLQDKQESSANDNNGDFSLFSTGRGKKLVVSEEAMNKARSKLEEKEDTISPIDNSFSLFSTGRGKKLEVSEEAMNRARTTLQEKQENSPSDNSFSLFSTGRGKKLEVSEEAMNKAKEQLQPSSSLFTTGTGRQVSISKKNMDQAASLLESIAQQGEENIMNQHPLAASPEKEEPNPILSHAGNQRVEVEVPIECTAPRKHPLPPPSPPPLQKEKPLLNIPKRTVTKKKKKGYVPMKIMNNNYIYENEKERKEGVKVIHHDEMKEQLRQAGYTDCSGPPQPGFHSISSVYGKPFAKEYETLEEEMMKRLEENQLSLSKEWNVLDSMDGYYIKSSCEYSIQSQFNQELLSYGFSSFLLSITYRNAEFVVYDSMDDNTLPSSFHTDSNQVNPFFQQLKDYLIQVNADDTLISIAWIRCQYRNILIKQLAKSKWMKDPSYCTLKWIKQQLLWRFYTELYLAKPPPIKRLVQRDESEGRFIVLLVSDIIQCPPCYDYDLIEEKKEEKKEIPQATIELTDGWYFIEAVLDKSLTFLLQSYQIYPGLKLRISCSHIINNPNGCAPLEMKVNQPRIYHPTDILFTEEDGLVNPQYTLQYNSTRRAVWNSHLGFTTVFTFNTNINDCINDGGVIPQTDILITRKFGIRYVEMVDGKKISRTEEEERVAQQQWEDQQMRIREEIMMKVSKQWEQKMELSNSQFNSSQDVDIKALQQYQLQKENEQHRQVEEEMEKKGLKEREVVMVGTLHVASPYRDPSSSIQTTSIIPNLLKRTYPQIDPVIGSSNHVYPTIQVILWNTNTAILDSLQEGHIYRVTMLSTQQKSEITTQQLLLFASNSTHWDDITTEYKQQHQNDSFSIYDVWKPRELVNPYECQVNSHQSYDLLLFYLCKSDQKQREQEETISYYYDLFFCDIHGSLVMVSLSDQLYQSIQSSLSVFSILFLKDVFFKYYDMKMNFYLFQFTSLSRCYSSIPSSFTFVKQIASCCKEAAKHTLIQQMLVSQLNYIQQVFHQAIPSSPLHNLLLAFFTQPLSLGCLSILLFGNPLEAMRVMTKRRSLQGLSTKRRNQHNQQKSTTKDEDGLFVKQPEEIHSLLSNHQCPSLQQNQFSMNACDLMDNHHSLTLSLSFQQIQYILTRIVSIDSLQGYSVLHSIQQLLEQSECHLELFHNIQFSKTTSLEFARDYLYLVLSHAIDENSEGYSCGLTIPLQNEQIQSISQLFAQLTDSMIWIIQEEKEGDICTVQSIELV